jgi:hypothetical protein
VCHTADLCTVSVCSEPEGTCEGTPVVCPTGQACNPSNGACESSLPRCGNCTTFHGSPGCEVPACAAYVCEHGNPSCCSNGWTIGDSGNACFQVAAGECPFRGLCTP